jgi:hypothetical protein
LTSEPTFTGTLQAASRPGLVETKMSCWPARADVKYSSVSSDDTVGLPSNTGLFTTGPRLCAAPNSQRLDARSGDVRGGAHDAISQAALTSLAMRASPAAMRIKIPAR